MRYTFPTSRTHLLVSESDGQHSFGVKKQSPYWDLIANGRIQSEQLIERPALSSEVLSSMLDAEMCIVRSIENTQMTETLPPAAESRRCLQASSRARDLRDPVRHQLDRLRHG
jgi:hypothetical protein